MASCLLTRRWWQVRGTLTAVDARLNCLLSPAESAHVVVEVMWCVCACVWCACRSSGVSHRVAGRNIKYVHLAATADPDALWRAHVKAVGLEKHRQRKQRSNRRTERDVPAPLARKQAARGAATQQLAALPSSSATRKRK